MRQGKKKQKENLRMDKNRGSMERLKFGYPLSGFSASLLAAGFFSNPFALYSILW